MRMRTSPKAKHLSQKLDAAVEHSRYAQDATQSSQEYAFLDSPEDPYYLASDKETSQVLVSHGVLSQ